MKNHDHTVTDHSSPSHMFAKVFGPILLLVGILGLVLGDRLLLDVLNIDLLEDIIHVASGLLLIYLGFKASRAIAKTGVLVLGVVYLVVAALGFLAPDLIESIFPHGYTVVDNLIHLATGLLAVVAAMMTKTNDADHVA